MTFFIGLEYLKGANRKYILLAFHGGIISYKVINRGVKKFSC